jgi:hypothetical protein
MPAILTKPATATRLRIVFDDSSQSFGLSPLTTMADVAGRVVDIAAHHHAAPVAVDITLAPVARRIRAKWEHFYGTN